MFACVVVFGRRLSEKGGSRSRAAPVAKFGVDLNHASRSEVESLPGVGARLAARIVAARETLPCGFRAIRDLDDVPGIGPATMRRLTPLVRFERVTGCD